MALFYRILIALCLLVGGTLHAQDFDDFTEEDAEEPTTPLFEKMPFDRLILTYKYNGATYDVLPITFQGGSRPNPLPRIDALVVRLVNMPLKELSVFWTDIERIDLFCELVEKEFVRRLENLARNMTEKSPRDDDWTELADRFELMFDYLRFLDKYRNELPNYEKSYLRFLFVEGSYRMRSSDYPGGSARFEIVYGRDGVNKNYPDLEKTWAEALDSFMKEEFLSGNEAGGRKYLERFREFYPKNSVVETWEKQLRTTTLRRCEQSKKAFENRQFLDAHLHFEEAAKITVDLPELIEWKRTFFAKAPRVDIAVSTPLYKDTKSNVADLPDWGTRRGRRLLARMLVEYQHSTLEGGVYGSVLGEIETNERNRLIRWTFSEDRRRAFRFNVYDVAETVLTFSRPSENVSPPLENVIESVDVTAPDRLDIRLRQSHLIPESLFMLPVTGSQRFAVPDPETDAVNDLAPVFHDGMFDWKYGTDRVNGFELAGRMKDMTPTDHDPVNVVFEHAVPRGEEAVELLLAGKIDVVDRIPPWELEKFRENRDFVTGRYSIPTVHFLVPNMNNPLLASRTFRRALLYGLNRSGMLGKLLEKGGHGEVISAPFIKGAALDDPLGYAYDASIRPRPYEPKLAMALSMLAFDQVRNREPGWEEKVEMPTLVLARPKHEMAEYIALMIRRQWEAIGVPVTVTEYRDDEPVGRNDKIDFWLVERVVEEPLVDARRIFGVAGLLHRPSPYMQLALEKLHVAENWPMAGRCLHDIHRLCFEETTVIPLWQLTEHYVHRVGIGGVKTGEDIPSLYRNILHWTALPR